MFVRLAWLVSAALWASLLLDTSKIGSESFRWISVLMLVLSIAAAALVNARKHPEPSPARQPVPLPHDMSKYRAPLAAGKKIEAIKLLRADYPQLSLTAAKDIVESL